MPRHDPVIGVPLRVPFHKISHYDPRGLDESIKPFWFVDMGTHTQFYFRISLLRKTGPLLRTGEKDLFVE
jgi:hypothetical protein